MLPIHWRLAELWTIQQQRKLSKGELDEMNICLQYNTNYASKLAGLYNLSLVASMTNDTDYLHEICEKIDKLEIEYRIKKPASYNEN